MAEFCLVASHGYPPGLVSFPDQSICRPSKEYQPILPGLRSRHDTGKPCSLCYPSFQIEDSRKFIGVSEGTQLMKIDEAIKRHLVNGAQVDTRPNSLLLSLGIARQIIMHEKILKFLSDSSVIERGELDISMLSDLMGLQELTINTPQEQFVPEQRWCYDADSQPSIIYPGSECCLQKPFLDMTESMGHQSEFVYEPDGQLAFTGVGTQMNDILSVIPEFYSPKSSFTAERQSLLVPYFNRRKRSAAKAGGYGSPVKLATVTVAPDKSPEKAKAKQSLKKRSTRKTDRERDMYTNNYVLACENLLSVMIDRKRQGKTAIQSLKKSGPELPQLLTQFSASIAGTGIAVLFCVVCKLACSSAPLCASKILSSGLGLGLVWFSWAVNRLRDTILYINKKPGRSDQGEEDMMKILDRSVNEIYFRAATVLAVVVLRLA